MHTSSLLPLTLLCITTTLHTKTESSQFLRAHAATPTPAPAYMYAIRLTEQVRLRPRPQFLLPSSHHRALSAPSSPP